MERARKMYLVDSADLRNVKKRYSDLDKNISEVLERENLDDGEKLTLYRQALNKYLINRRLVESELEEKPPKVRVSTPKEKSVEEAYLESLPSVEERKKAARAIADVTSHTPLSWDDKGRLVHQGRIVEGSSLPEIIGHHLKLSEQKSKKKATEPIGWETFDVYRPELKADVAPPPRRSKRRRRQKVELDWEAY
jgi:hypothetical protein